MVTLTEPQVWTLIGVFAAIMLGGMTLMTTLLMHSFTKSFEGFRGEMRAKFETVNEKFETVNEKFFSLEQRVDSKFELVEIRFGAIEKKLEHLDRDVQAISRRVFSDDTK